MKKKKEAVGGGVYRSETRHQPRLCQDIRVMSNETRQLLQEGLEITGVAETRRTAKDCRNTRWIQGGVELLHLLDIYYFSFSFCLPPVCRNKKAFGTKAGVSSSTNTLMQSVAPGLLPQSRRTF